MTDLESEVNKTRFYEKNQYGLCWTFPSIQTESLHEHCTVTPAISVGGEPLDLENPTRGNIPQLIRNQNCRDGVRCHGERDAFE